MQRNSLELGNYLKEFNLLSLLLAAILGFQSLTVSPNVVNIPPGKEPYDVWPDYESDPRVGYQTFTIKYNVGPNGFPKDGKLQFMFGYQTLHTGNSNPAFDNNFGWIQVPMYSTNEAPMGRFQLQNQNQPNYTTVSCPSSGLKKRLIHKTSDLETILEIQANANIPANTDITIVFGDTMFGSPGATISWQPGRPCLVCFEDANNDGTFAPATNSFPEVLFTGQSADGFVINAPMYAQIGVPQRVTIRAVQGRDDTPESFICPVENFASNVFLTCSDTSALFSRTIPANMWDHGATEFTITFMTAGYHTIKAMIPNNPQSTTCSNTAFCHNGVPFKILSGDLQRHSGEGGHASIPDAYVWYNLYSNNDSYGCVVQHSETDYSGFAGANDIVGLFQNGYDPTGSSFIAFPGYEWSLPGQHRHIVYKDKTTNVSIVDRPYLGSEPPPPISASTMFDFFNELNNQPGEKMAIVHHSLWNKSNFPDEPYDWSPLEVNGTQPLVEIYSNHGCSERYFGSLNKFNYVLKHDLDAQRPPEEMASFADALRLGYKFGVIGGSDVHAYVPYSLNGQYSRPGLGFVVSNNPNISLRDQIWDAFKDKHSYATTGAKIHLLFYANSNLMGSTIHSGSCVFTVRAHASTFNGSTESKFIRLIIYRDGYDEVVSNTYFPAINDILFTWQDPNPINDGNEHSYFVKIIQNDAHIAWSSPIWWLKL